MYKSRIRSFGKCVMYAAILIAVLILTALVITKIAMCPLNDALFMEGILFIMLGVFFFYRRESYWIIISSNGTKQCTIFS